MRYGHYIDTPIGRLYLVEENGYLVRLDGGEADNTDILQCTPLLEKAVQQLQEYFSRGRQDFTLPVHMHGTDFQKKVWQALLQIPYGETCTYGEIARIIGSPGGARAVGGACNRNPIMIVVPCHRVIGAGGKPVGFGGGLKMKEELLSLEGVTHFISKNGSEILHDDVK